MADLCQGAIVWVKIPDEHNRNEKLRPAVVVTPTEELSTADEFVVVAITSRFDLPLTDNLVELPWHRDGHPRTGLKRRCVAVCDWMSAIPRNSIEEIAGRVPGAQLNRILSILARKLDQIADEEE